ncbi:MAG: hypothetical protein V4459_14380 [Pseudomonadota bacterium]
MKTFWVSLAYWLDMAIIAATVFLASNFAGSSGTPIFLRPTLDVIAVGAVTYLVALIIIRRRKRL